MFVMGERSTTERERRVSRTGRWTHTPEQDPETFTVIAIWPTSWADDPRFEAVDRDGVWIGVCHVCKIESVPVEGWGDNWDSAVTVIHRHQSMHEALEET